jgi:hypothetical protein
MAGRPLRGKSLTAATKRCCDTPVSAAPRERDPAANWSGEEHEPNRGVAVSATGGVTRRRRTTAAVIAGFGVVITACASHTPDPVLSDASAVATTAAATTSALSDAYEFSGTYHIKYTDGIVRTWTASPCGQACAHVAQKLDGEGSWTFDAEAHLEGTTWKMSIWDPESNECRDGRKIAGTTTWTWDASTLTGTLLGETNSPCGEPMPDFPFVLTKQSGVSPTRSPSLTPR